MERYFRLLEHASNRVQKSGASAASSAQDAREVIEIDESDSEDVAVIDRRCDPCVSDPPVANHDSDIEIVEERKGCMVEEEDMDDSALVAAAEEVEGTLGQGSAPQSWLQVACVAITYTQVAQAATRKIQTSLGEYLGLRRAVSAPAPAPPHTPKRPRFERRPQSDPERPKPKCPFYKWIPSTPFTGSVSHRVLIAVDAFRYGSIEGCEGALLEHRLAVSLL